jgi:PKHD-type hydroxylase
MKGEWCYFSNRFTDSQCKSIISEIKTRPAQDATLGVDGERSDNSYRRSKIRFVQRNDLILGWIFDEIWKMAIQANDEWFGFHLLKMDYIQIAEYTGTDKGEYKTHHDVFYMNKTDYHRKLSAIIQLSDPTEYEGGDFQMYEIEQQPTAAALKTQGTAIFFPSFIRHAALPVTNGTRYSIAAWIDGPRWR